MKILSTEIFLQSHLGVTLGNFSPIYVYWLSMSDLVPHWLFYFWFSATLTFFSFCSPPFLAVGRVGNGCHEQQSSLRGSGYTLLQIQPQARRNRGNGRNRQRNLGQHAPLHRSSDRPQDGRHSRTVSENFWGEPERALQEKKSSMIYHSFSHNYFMCHHYPLYNLLSTSSSLLL